LPILGDIRASLPLIENGPACFRGMKFPDEEILQTFLREDLTNSLSKIKSFSTNVSVALSFSELTKDYKDIMRMQLVKYGFQDSSNTIGLVIVVCGISYHDVCPLSINKSENEV
jgi:hypothetical protein